MSKLVDTKLMQAVPFTEKDLKINQQGRLSENQKQSLKRTFEIYIGINAFVSAFCFFVAVVILFVGIKTQTLFFMAFFSILGFSLCFYWAFWSI